jgi:hypothetical protein
VTITDAIGNHTHTVSGTITVGLSTAPVDQPAFVVPGNLFVHS